jgi:hypothetical protein
VPGKSRAKLPDYVSDEAVTLVLKNAMPGKLKLALSSCFSLVTSAAILFVPAGSLRFWQAWVFLFLLFVPGMLDY